MRVVKLSWSVLGGRRITEQRVTNAKDEQLIALVLSFNCATYRIYDVEVTT